jgi:hypothetical protein
VQVQRPDRPLPLNHEQHRDRTFVHHANRLGGERVGLDRARRRGHDLDRAASEQAVLHMAPQIAIGDDPGQHANPVQHADAAEALGRHLQEDVGHGRVERDQRQCTAAMHQVLDPDQLLAELSPRVQQAELARAKAAAFEQRYRERITERQHDRARCGRGKSHRAGFGPGRQHQGKVSGFGEAAVSPADHGEQRDREAAGIGHDVGQLRGLARVGQGQNRVVLGNHAEIAVAGFAGVDVEGRRSGRCQRGGNLPRDVTALAHAGHHGPATRLRQSLDGSCRQSFRLDAQDASPGVQGRAGPARAFQFVRQRHDGHLGLLGHAVRPVRGDCGARCGPPLSTRRATARLALPSQVLHPATIVR